MNRFIKRTLRILLPVAIIGAGVIGFGLLKVDKSEDKPQVQQQRAWLVSAQEVAKQTLFPSVQLFGRVVTRSHSTLSSILDGKVIEVDVLPGQSVDVGDVLIRLGSRTIETQLRQIQADIERIKASLKKEDQKLQADTEILVHENRLLELATESLNRAQTLKSRNLISQAEFDTFERTEQQAHLSVTAREASIRDYDNRVALLEAELKRNQASLDKANLDLEDTVISAPYSGRITEVHVAMGTQVRYGTPLLALYDARSLEVRTMIPNRYLAQLRGAISEGSSLEATAELDDHDLKLQFDRLASIVDQGRGGVDAYFHLASNPMHPELGRSVSLVLTMAPIQNAIAIPYQSIYGSNQVFKIESGVLKSVTIERHGQVRIDDSSFVVGTSPQLQDGDLIVTTQLTNAVDGLPVQLWNGS